MSHADTIRRYLEEHGPLCDDCISDGARIRPRQTVNIVCRGLSKSSELRRTKNLCSRCRGTKLLNYLSPAFAVAAVEPSTRTVDSAKSRPWYWEGNVQTRIVEYLEREQGLEIVATADTAAREAGKDIVSRSAGKAELWISVKGYPERSPHAQARHWFSQAMFDLVLYRDLSTEATLGMGLPAGFSTYRRLADRVNWIRSRLPFWIFWVSENGEVTCEDPPSDAP